MPSRDEQYFRRGAEVVRYRRAAGIKSSDIEKVLSVIRTLPNRQSAQPYAAILAAQAGEYGKSFSVVADEISALSEGRQFNAEIGGIVKTIQKDIKDAGLRLCPRIKGRRRQLSCFKGRRCSQGHSERV